MKIVLQADKKALKPAKNLEAKTIAMKAKLSCFAGKFLQYPYSGRAFSGISKMGSTTYSSGRSARVSIWPVARKRVATAF